MTRHVGVAALATPTRPASPTTPWAAEVVPAVHDRLAALADPDRAMAMRSYQRDQFPFFGVASPAVAAVWREVVRSRPAPDEADVLTAARGLWDLDEREHQYAGMKLLRRYVRRLSTEALPAVAWCLTTKAWWDTVDDLAQNVVGPLVLADRERLRPVLDRWVAGDDRWLARTAILHQNTYKAATDQQQLFTYCLLRAGDTDFFVRKAIGWALRQHARTDPDAVAAFVDDHVADLSTLSVREATKHLGP